MRGGLVISMDSSLSPTGERRGDFARYGPVKASVHRKIAPALSTGKALMSEVETE